MKTTSYSVSGQVLIHTLVFLSFAGDATTMATLMRVMAAARSMKPAIARLVHATLASSAANCSI